MSAQDNNPDDKKSPADGAKRPTPPFRLRQIKSLDDPGVAGFIRVYKDAFSGPPYFENYSDEYVRDNILIPHLPYWVGIAENDEGVIGLCCVHPFNADVSPEATAYVKQQPKEQIPFELELSVYGSEFATLSTVRKMGVGGYLMGRSFRWAHDNGFPYAIMRTAADGSNSVRMLQREGAVLLPFVQEVGDKGVDSKSEQRVWLYIKTEKFAGFGQELEVEPTPEPTPAPRSTDECGGWLCRAWRAICRFFASLAS